MNIKSLRQGLFYWTRSAFERKIYLNGWNTAKRAGRTTDNPYKDLTASMFLWHAGFVDSEAYIKAHRS